MQRPWTGSPWPRPARSAHAAAGWAGGGGGSWGPRTAPSFPPTYPVAPPSRSPSLPPQGNQEQLCGPCICTIGETLAPAAAVAGITPEQVQNTSEADARALITACAGVLIRPLAAAGVRLNSLMALQQCTKLPECLAALGFSV